MSTVDCRINIPPIENLEQGLSVGREFILLCQGEWPKLNPQKVEMRVEEADKYKIRLLSYNPIDSSTAELKVTSYVAGKHEIKAVQIVDSEQSVVLGDLKFEVGSVLKEGEQTEPYGPFGPLTLSWPIIIWIVIAALVIAELIRDYRWWMKRREKKRLLNELKNHDFSLTPYFQFQKSIRNLSRQFAFFSDVRLATPGMDLKKPFQDLKFFFRLYVGREFLIPTLHWKDSWVLKDLKKNHKAYYEQYGQSLKKIFSEFDRAEKSLAKLSPSELTQIFNMTRVWSDKIEVSKNSQGKMKA